MLCCVGLFAGAAVGQSLGGPWTVIAPAAGFGIGFLADMKMMKGMHGHKPAQPPRAQPHGALEAGAEPGAAPAARQLPAAAQDAGPA